MFVLLTCFVLTVFFDMVVAVSVGVVLAALLFMRRMAELTESRTLASTTPRSPARSHLPRASASTRSNGPLFFGAAQNAMEALHASARRSLHVLILHLGQVPVIDATGFVALENAIDALDAARRRSWSSPARSRSRGASSRRPAFRRSTPDFRSPRGSKPPSGSPPRNRVAPLETAR